MNVDNFVPNSADILPLHFLLPIDYSLNALFISSYHFPLSYIYIFELWFCEISYYFDFEVVEYLNIIETLDFDTQLERPWIHIHALYFNHHVTYEYVLGFIPAMR